MSSIDIGKPWVDLGDAQIFKFVTKTVVGCKRK